MSLDKAVYATLNDDGHDPLYRGWLPEGQSLPCVVVRFVSDRPRNTLTGPAGHKNQIIAVDCWGKTLDEAEALRDQALATLERADYPLIRRAIRPLHEPETKTFRFTIEYSVWGY